MEGGRPDSKVRVRAGWLCIALSVLFVLLAARILIYQTFQHDIFKQKVMDQITREITIDADRGKILDTNGIAIATNVTAYDLFIDPAAIARKSREDGKNYAEIIAKGVSEIESLGISYEKVMEASTHVDSQYRQLIQRNDPISKEQAELVRAFIKESGIENMALLNLQAVSKRYYPYGSLACHVLGFTSGDGEGLYGLEYQYNDVLSGTDGKYIGAKDSYGNELVYDYESYIPATDGYNITTTIDVYIQAELEEQLKTTYHESGGKNRACGIVMDTETGAILAMAVYPSYDLNNPRELNYQAKAILDEACAKLKSCGYREGSEEFKKYALEIYCKAADKKASQVTAVFDTYIGFEDSLRLELLMASWLNKAVNEMYMPGSTFKVITAAMGYEERVVDDEVDGVDIFVNCPGYRIVMGQKIKCHYHAGHGDVTFARGLQQSCNPALMRMGEELGAETYLRYFETFGYFEKSGIDIPGESVTTKGVTFWDDEEFLNSPRTPLNLAVASFGQNFKISPITHITAINAVANDGYLVTPHFIKEITDNEGNVIYSYETTVRRQVISSATSEKVSQVLEAGVSGDGGAKNAYVAGYRVAAKTGTSEKKDTNRDAEGYIPYVCSTVAYAPAENPKITALILVDEPTEGVLYASTIAAPYIGKLMEEILPYYGVEAKYSDKELDKQTIQAPFLIGSGVEGATNLAELMGFKVEIRGDGDRIKAQSPAPGSEVEIKNATIIIYTTDEAVEEKRTVTVPKLEGMTAAAANGTLINLGLNIKIEGTKNYLSGKGALVVAQDIAPGTEVQEGTVITVTFRHLDDEDDFNFDDVYSDGDGN